MPLNSPISENRNAAAAGTLYVVATPIGNRDDITLRALKTLAGVDLIAAEDTRKTGRLLARHRIKGRLVSCHEHNEEKRTPELLQKLLAGSCVALVSNAGTPAVSDPGYRLIRSAIAAGVAVVPIPGVSAATTALSVAGLPTDAFRFIGFTVRKKAKRLKQLAALADETATLVFYEPPQRILSLMEDILTILGDRPAVLAREMTKLHEEFIRGRLSTIIANLRSRAEIRGECTLLVAADKKKPKGSPAELKAAIRAASADGSRPMSELVKEIAGKYGVSKSRVYRKALKFRAQNSEKA